MKRVALALIVAVIAVLGITAPAQAGTGSGNAQKIANSSGSFTNSAVQYYPNYSGLLYPGQSRNLPFYTKIGFEAGSYRVAYDYGSYGACKNTTNHWHSFIPWDGANVIYFKLYKNSNCKN